MINRRYNLFAVLALSATMALTVGCFLLSIDRSEGDATSPPAGATAECRVEVITEGMGEVTVECGSDASFATLTAVPADGWRFDRWLGIGASGNTAMVGTGGSGTVTAVFVSLDDSLLDPAGDLETDDTADEEDDDVPSDDGDDQDQDADQGTDDDQEAEEADLVTITVVDGTGSGEYERDTVVTIVASVPQGKQFDKWVGDVEFIVSGLITEAVIEVRAGSNISLIATFISAPADAQPPTIAIDMPSSPGTNDLIVFDRSPVTITITAQIFEGSQDVVKLFVDRDDPPNRDDDDVIFANGFSTSGSLDLDVTILEKGVLYNVGAIISDGLNTTVSTYNTGRIRRSTLPPIYWVGSINTPSGAPPQTLSGMILGGVNVEDNAGTAFAGGEDLTGDGVDDFVVVARYAKSEFRNPNGVGIGEAYLVAGASTRRTGEFNLNSTSSPGLPGVVFRGVVFDFDANDTDGLSSVVIVPDADFDSRGELVFGVPRVDSAGSNAPLADGTLDRPGQLLRGGAVIVSSKDIAFGALTDGTRVRLDWVGQRFLQSARFGLDFPVPEPENGPLAIGGIGQSPCVDDSSSAFTLPGGFIPEVHGWYVDVQSYEEGDLPTDTDPGTCSRCVGSVFEPETDDSAETWIEPSHGFSDALAPPFPIRFCGSPSPCPANPIDTVDPPSPPASTGCPDVFGFNCATTDPTTSCVCGLSAGSCGLNCTQQQSAPCSCSANQPINIRIGTGFYPDRIYGDIVTASGTSDNSPRDPLGARVVGRSEGDKFGTSVTVSAGDAPGEFWLIVSSPQRSGRIAETPALGSLDSLEDNNGLWQCLDGTTCDATVPGACGEDCGIVRDSGVAYIFRNLNYWEPDPNTRHVPPKPHQYIVAERSHCGRPNPTDFMETSEGTVGRPFRRGFDADIEETPERALTIVGQADEKIENILGISDFNNDGRGDIAVGAPNAGNGGGAVYVLFRRADDLEGDFVLEKITFATGDPKRLDGVFIRGVSGSQFGSSIASGFDFNHDGINDVVVGAPGSSSGAPGGEVVVIFGGTNVSTPGGGRTVQQLVGNRQAMRIFGDTAQAGGGFGFNVANAGDVDGDGTNDLLVAAPSATPMFDSNPFDTTDELTTRGLDMDHNGDIDDVSGPQGRPDGAQGGFDELANAGLVYLILGSNDFSGIQTINVSRLGKNDLQGGIFVGRRGDRGAIAGADYLGGGDAGDTTQGGNAAKAGRGRSRGLTGIGDIDSDGRDDFVLGSILADTRLDVTGSGRTNAGEAYVIYGFEP